MLAGLSANHSDNNLFKFKVAPPVCLLLSCLWLHGADEKYFRSVRDDTASRCRLSCQSNARQPAHSGGEGTDTFLVASHWHDLS